MVEAAAAATLPGIGDGLEPFTIAESTACGMKARADREGRGEAPDAADELAGVMRDVRRLASLIGRVIEAEDAKPAGDVDLDRVRHAALVAERIGKRRGRTVNSAGLDGWLARPWSRRKAGWPASPEEGSSDRRPGIRRAPSEP